MKPRIRKINSRALVIPATTSEMGLATILVNDITGNPTEESVRTYNLALFKDVCTFLRELKEASQMQCIDTLAWLLEHRHLTRCQACSMRDKLHGWYSEYPIHGRVIPVCWCCGDNSAGVRFKMICVNRNCRFPQLTVTSQLFTRCSGCANQLALKELREAEEGEHGQRAEP